MDNTEFCYFHILKADQTVTHQNMWLGHVRSARNWTLVISRNLHKTSGAITGFWGRAASDPAVTDRGQETPLPNPHSFFLASQNLFIQAVFYALIGW